MVWIVLYFAQALFFAHWQERYLHDANVAIFQSAPGLTALQALILRYAPVNIDALFTFQGQSVAELKKAFRESVEDYLDFCASRGEEPGKPFSGHFVTRVSPDLHRQLKTRRQPFRQEPERLGI